MTAHNGDIGELTQGGTVGLRVRALVGSSWGFHAVPDLSDPTTRDAGRRAAQIAAASARIPGPPLDPGRAGHRELGLDLAEGLYQVWDTAKWFVSSEGHRINQCIRECGGGISATSIGAGPTRATRASTASAGGNWSTRST